jgi:hypothetical protein
LDTFFKTSNYHPERSPAKAKRRAGSEGSHKLKIEMFRFAQDNNLKIKKSKFLYDEQKRELLS